MVELHVIAWTERVIRTFKDGRSRRILVPVPISHKAMEEEVGLFFYWNNGH